MKTNYIHTLVFTTLALLATSAFAEQAEHKSYRHSQKQVLTFDVAEAGAKFSFDEAPLLPSGLPAYGNAFITQGYIYPKGTLQGDHGVNPNGSPEYPDKVIGEWTCRGYFIGDGFDTKTGPVVMTTQHYDFYKDPGFEENKRSSTRNLVSDGYELIDVGVPSKRAITGGTGRFNDASGQATQVLLGMNANDGVNLRFRVVVR